MVTSQTAASVRDPGDGAALCDGVMVIGRSLTWPRGSADDLETWIEARRGEDAVRQNSVDDLKLELVSESGEIRRIFVTPSSFRAHTLGSINVATVDFVDEDGESLML